MNKITKQIRILWYFKKLSISIFAYSLLLTLSLLYFGGAVHYDYVENDFIISEIEYSISLKNKIREMVTSSLEARNPRRLKKFWKSLMGNLLIMVQDGKRYEMFYDSHEKYRFIRANKELDTFEFRVGDKFFTISIYSLKKQKWNSVYKHWLKYFVNTFRLTSKYLYLTISFFVILPSSFFLILYINSRIRIQKIYSNSKKI